MSDRLVQFVPQNTKPCKYMYFFLILVKATYYGLHEQVFYADKDRDFPRYHHVDYVGLAHSHQIRQSVISETKQPQREKRIFSALPPDAYKNNIMTIKLRPFQAQNVGNFCRYLFVLSMLLTA